MLRPERHPRKRPLNTTALYWAWVKPTRKMHRLTVMNHTAKFCKSSKGGGTPDVKNLVYAPPPWQSVGSTTIHGLALWVVLPYLVPV